MLVTITKNAPIPTGYLFEWMSVEIIPKFQDTCPELTFESPSSGGGILVENASCLGQHSAKVTSNIQ